MVAKAVAIQLESQHPQLVTAEYRKAKRPHGRVLVGPQAGRERTETVIGGRVDRIQVAAGSTAHGEGSGEVRSAALPVVDEADGAVGRSECGAAGPG